MAPGDLRVEVLQEPDARVAAGIRVRAVGGELDEVDGMRDRDGAGQVGEEDETGLQRRDEQRLAPLVVACDLPTELTDACLQLPTREVDVAQLIGSRAYDASSSRYRSARRSMSRL
jgi:hypothetical protein